MTDYIIKDIQQVAGYLPAGILCGLAAVAIYLIYVKWIQKNERRETAGTGANLRNSLIWFLLAVYMTFMFITVFLSREPGSRQGIDMKLFGTWGETPQAHAFVIENILLFVPFGILYPAAVSARRGTPKAGIRNCADKPDFIGDGFVSASETDIKIELRRKVGWEKFTVPWGFLISVGIEMVQLITERGYCQLDDVVMNTFGSLIGYIIFLTAAMVMGRRRKDMEE